MSRSLALRCIPCVVALLLVDELDLVVSISGKTVTNEFKVNKPPITPLLRVSKRSTLDFSCIAFDNILVISE